MCVRAEVLNDRFAVYLRDGKFYDRILRGKH